MIVSLEIKAIMKSLVALVTMLKVVNSNPKRNKGGL